MAVETGGTYTDLIEQDGQVRSHKRPSTAATRPRESSRD